MNHDLTDYLNHHLAGSQTAVAVLDELARRTEDDEQRHTFFTRLKGEIEGDQDQLRAVLEAAGLKEKTLPQLAGKLGGTASRLGFGIEGMDTGDLGLLESLEMLALGIEGKRLLWILLDEIAHEFPEWDRICFGDLERRAELQRQAVENLRLKAARAALKREESAAPAA